MKMLVLLLIPLALLGCDIQEARRYEWVIERQGRSPEAIQRDLNIMGLNGWVVDDDDDLETSGHYIYFMKAMYPENARVTLKATFDALKGNPSQD